MANRIVQINEDLANVDPNELLTINEVLDNSKNYLIRPCKYYFLKKNPDCPNLPRIF